MGTATVAERTPRLGLYAWEDGADLYNHIQLNYNWVLLDGSAVTKNWAGTADDITDMRFVGSGNLTDWVIAVRDSYTDTENRFEVLSGGTVKWGSGTSAVDTNLYRASAGVLATDSQFKITSGSVHFLNGTVTLTAGTVPTNQLNTNGLFAINRPANGTALTVTSSAGTIPTFLVTSEGYLGWGTGTLAQDVAIFRSGAGTLSIDADLYVTGKISLGSAASNGWSVTNVSAGVKTYDANNTSIHELADVVGNLIDDLKNYGLLGA